MLMKKRNILNWILPLIVFTCTGFLFYHQAYGNGACYPSDLPAHIGSALSGGGYSLMSAIFRLLYRICPHKVFLTTGLAVIAAGTIFVSAFYMQVVLEQMGVRFAWNNLIIFSCSTLFLASVYIPVFFPEVYRGALLTQPWHNSTYLLMRMVGTLVIVFYMKINIHYLSYITWKEALLFTLLLTCTNYAKPNFIIAFAPVMLFFLMWDFIRLKGHKAIQMIKFGTCVLLSLWILVIQYRILYPSQGESGIAFTLEKMQAVFSNPLTVLEVTAGLGFPILVLILAFSKRYVPVNLVQSWLLFFVSWLEARLFTETGPRAMHGNFGWGLRMMTFILYLSSSAVLFALYKKGKVQLYIYRMLWAVYVGCVGSGIRYFIKLLAGGAYYV